MLESLTNKGNVEIGLENMKFTCVRDYFRNTDRKSCKVFRKNYPSYSVFVECFRNSSVIRLGFSRILESLTGNKKIEILFRLTFKIPIVSQRLFSKHKLEIKKVLSKNFLSDSVIQGSAMLRTLFLYGLRHHHRHHL